MKTKLKISLICVCIFSLLFCFSGCDFGLIHLDTTPTDPTVRHTSDDEVVQDYTPIQEETPVADIFEEGALQEYIDVLHGVKTVYLPAVDGNYLQTTDQTLLAQRQKFNQNAADQYYYMAWYVLTALVDRYGVETGQQQKTYQAFTAVSESDRTITYNDDIETSYLKIEGYIEGSDPAEFDASKRWICSLATDSQENYQSRYLSTFVPYVQLRFMEIALNQPATSLDSVISGGTVLQNVVDEKINNYVAKIKTLGINNLMLNSYIEFLTNSVVGNTSYQTEIGSIVQKFLNDFASSFPNYSRTESAELTADVFYAVGEKEDPAKLHNIDYQEYQSCTFFYNDSTQLAQTIYEIYVDSKRDIVVDVYVLLSKADGPQKVEYLCTLHTVADEDVDYSSDSDEDVINNAPTNYNSIFLYDEITSEQIAADEFLNVYLNPESENFGTKGTQESPISSQNTQNCKFLAYDENANIHSLATPVQKGSEVVDLSDIKFFADFSQDCVVLLFDIQYANGGTVEAHDANDYSFKFVTTIEGMEKEDILSEDEENEEDTGNDDDDELDDDD